jgi:hypothetical protein
MSLYAVFLHTMESLKTDVPWPVSKVHLARLCGNEPRTKAGYWRCMARRSLVALGEQGRTVFLEVCHYADS